MIPDGDGKGNSQQPHSDICHRQWHHEEVGDALQVGVEADGPAHQDVPSHSQAGDHQLQANVDQLFILLHGCFFPPSCFLCAFIPHAQLLDVFSDAGTRLPNRIGASQGKSDCVTGGRPRQEVPTTNMALVMPDFTFTFNRYTHTHTHEPVTLPLCLLSRSAWWTFVTDGSGILRRKRLEVLPDGCQIKSRVGWRERERERESEGTISVACTNRLQVTTHASEKPSISGRQFVSVQGPKPTVQQCTFYSRGEKVSRNPSTRVNHSRHCRAFPRKSLIIRQNTLPINLTAVAPVLEHFKKKKKKKNSFAVFFLFVLNCKQIRLYYPR